MLAVQFWHILTRSQSPQFWNESLNVSRSPGPKSYLQVLTSQSPRVSRSQDLKIKKIKNVNQSHSSVDLRDASSKNYTYEKITWWHGVLEYEILLSNCLHVITIKIQERGEKGTLKWSMDFTWAVECCGKDKIQCRLRDWKSKQKSCPIYEKVKWFLIIQFLVLFCFVIFLYTIILLLTFSN